MGLVRFGPVTLDVDDVRAIVERKGDPSVVEVTFRDGSRMEFDGAAADALRLFVLKLPDGLPPELGGPYDAAVGTVRRIDAPVVQRHEG